MILTVYVGAYFNHSWHCAKCTKRYTEEPKSIEIDLDAIFGDAMIKAKGKK